MPVSFEREHFSEAPQSCTLRTSASGSLSEPRTLVRTRRPLRKNNLIGAIFPTHGVPANPHHLRYHSHTVGQWIDTRAIVVAPPHRYFRDGESEALRQEQNFWIETPALDLL